MASIWLLCHKGLIGWVLQRSGMFFQLHWRTLQSYQSDLQVLCSHSWLKPFSLFAQFDWTASTKKCLTVLELLWFETNGSQWVLHGLQSCMNFSVPSPDMCLDSPVSKGYRHFLWPLGFTLLACIDSCGDLYRQRHVFINLVQSNEIYNRWTLIKL